MKEWFDERANEMRASMEEIRRLGDQLSYLQLGWRPPDGGWSIAQVFEHLLLTDAPYVEIIERLLAGAERSERPWKSTFMGRLVTRAVSPETARKVRARGSFQPGPQPRANIVGDYLAVREKLLELLERSRGVDLNRLKMKSPVMSIIRYNLGDGFMILTRHTQRHLQQIERVRQHPDFPKPASA